MTYLYKVFYKIPIIFLIVGFFSYIWADLDLNLDIQNIYDDNPFPNDTNLPSYINYSSLGISYFPFESNFGINYNLDLILFDKFSDRDYTNHKINLLYTIPFGDEENPDAAISLIGSISGRLNKKNMEFYDYYQTNGYADFEYFINEVTSTGISYRAKYRNYPNFKNMIYLENYISSFGISSLKSNTSINFGLDLGFKNYLSLNNNITDTFPNRIETMKVRVNRNYIKRIMRGRNNQQTTTPGIVYTNPNASLIRANLRVSQSLAEYSGLSFSISGQQLLSSEGTSIIGGSVDIIGEKELFDDPYSFSSNEFSLMFTQILFEELKCQISGFYLNKYYNYPANIDKEQSADREDSQYGIIINFEQDIVNDWSIFELIGLSLQYTNLRNESNSEIFDYHSNSVNFAISFDF